MRGHRLAVVIGMMAMCSTGVVVVEAANVNFAEHVAPVVFNHCAKCHRPGEAAPFSLTSYKEVKKRGQLLVDATKTRYMPPWHAEPVDVKFANERRLTDEQISVIRRWVESGMPEGDKSKTPALPKFTSGWQLGKPDLIVKMSEAFSVPADGPDIYRNFVIRLNLKEQKWVKAVEFRPGSPAIVHHSLFFLDTTGQAREADRKSPQPGFSRSMGSSVRSGGSLGGWAVGGSPQRLPSDLAFRVPAGADLVLSTHFHPSGKPEKEQSTVGLYFADRPPTNSFTAIQLPPVFGATARISIPPGEKRYTKRDSFVLPVDVKAFGVSAHAHYLGREMKMTATLPDGTVKKLFWIKKWDFNWQDQYSFADFVPLPKGTKIDAEVVWDNSSDNINNPSNPPVRVRWGRESTDEMGSVTLRVVPAKRLEIGKLKRELSSHRRSSLTRFSGQSDRGVRQRLIKRFDSDGDGRISDEERRKALQRLRRDRK